MLYTTHHRRQKESTLVAKLIQGLVDGLLIVLPSNLEASLEDLDGRNFPYVLLDHAGTGISSNTVKAKNWEGSFEATAYLIGLGHQHIGFVQGMMTVDSAQERLAGYKAALAEKGLAVDPALIQPGDFAWQSGYDAAINLLALSEPPTAVIASSDVCAFGVMEALRTQGLRVPEDVSVVGFDDIPEATTVRPSLTTMRQDLRQMGRISTRMLVECIDNPDHVTEHIDLPMELIVRESTAPCSIRQKV
jgi:LacI family transcriptional regulator